MAYLQKRILKLLQDDIETEVNFYKQEVNHVPMDHGAVKINTNKIAKI